MSGEALGAKYELRERIKTGGMSAVYKGWSRLHGESVVIKMILPHICEDERFRGMFLDEAFTSGRLKHPHIVAVRDFGEAEDETRSLYLVMDYIDGIDLRRLLREARGPLDPVVAARIAADVAVALDYAHSASDSETGEPLNIVHRDVSPSNILVDRAGHSYLTDFGIARIAAARHDQTRVGELKGKLAYMSPEQARSSPDIDGRADIYSLGLVMYECVTGGRAFDADTEEQLFNLVLDAAPDLEALGEGSVPSEVSAVILKALQAEPTDRYSHAGDMARDLEEYLQKAAPEGARVAVAEAVAAPATASVSREPAEEELLEPQETPAQAQVTEVMQAAPPLEGEKTVLDVAYDWFKFHRGRIYGFAGAATGLVLALLVLNVLLEWSDWGYRIKRRLWPKQGIIVTVPAGADVYLDGDPQEQDRLGEVSLDGLKPGSSIELVARMDGWLPDSTNRAIPIRRHAAFTDTLWLKRHVCVRVDPPDAGVWFVPPREVGSNYESPFCLAVEAGPCTVEIRRYSFLPLSGEKGISFDVASPQEVQYHRRYCTTRVRRGIGGDADTLLIEATLRKNVAIQVTPEDGELVVDDGSRETVRGDSIDLPAGLHTLAYRKAGWLDQEQQITVDADFEPDPVVFALSRRIHFVARVAHGPDRRRRDLRAQVSVLRVPDGVIMCKMTTPDSCELPAGDYTAEFSKLRYNTYRTKVIRVESDSLCEVWMEPSPRELHLRITEETQGYPVSDANIKYRHPGERMWHEEKADSEGRWVLVLRGKEILSDTLELKISSYACEETTLSLELQAAATLAVEQDVKLRYRKLEHDLHITPLDEGNRR